MVGLLPAIPARIERPEGRPGQPRRRRLPAQEPPPSAPESILQDLGWEVTNLRPIFLWLLGIPIADQLLLYLSTSSERGTAGPMQTSQTTFRVRAWAEAFPVLPRPESEPFTDEVYLIPLGLGGRDIKIRGGALEMKDLVLEQDGLPLWDPAVRLEFPIPPAWSSASSSSASPSTRSCAGSATRRRSCWRSWPRRAATSPWCRCRSAAACSRSRAAGPRAARSWSPGGAC